MPTGKNNEQQRNRQQRRELPYEEKLAQALKNRREQMDRHHKRKSAITERFGPDANLAGGPYKEQSVKDYKNIKLPVPKGLNEEMVAMIAMGVAMDPKYLPQSHQEKARNLNDELKANELLGLTWYIPMNLIHGDKRCGPYSESLVNARKDTVEILNNFEKDPEPVKQALGRVMNYMASTASSQQLTTDAYASEPFKEMNRIVNDMAKIPELGIDGMSNGTNTERYKANQQRVESAQAKDEAALKLVEDFPAAGSPEREKLVMDYLFNCAVAVEAESSMQSDVIKQVGKEIDDQMKHYTVLDKRSKGDVDKLGEFILIDNMQNRKDAEVDKKKADIAQRVMVSTREKMRLAVMDSCFTEGEAMLTEPNGKEQMRKISESAIKNSDAYKQLMSAKDPVEMDALLEKHSFKPFSDYGVKFPNEKQKQLNGSSAEQRKQMVDSAKKDLSEYFAGNMKDYLDDVMTDLDSSRIGHKDSKEIKDLREKVKTLKEAMNKAGHPFKDDPDVRKALMDTYKSTMAYKEKLGPNAFKKGWEPTSTMGKNRFRGANKLESLARSFVMDDIAAQATREENKALDEVRKENAMNTFTRGSELGAFFEEKVNALDQSMKNKGLDMAGAAENAALIVQEELAQVIAARVVGRAYQGAQNENGQLSEADRQSFKKDVQSAAEDIMGRDDFQLMIRSNSVLTLYNKAILGEGSPLMAELAKAKATLDSSKAQADKAKEWGAEKRAEIAQKKAEQGGMNM